MAIPILSDIWTLMTVLCLIFTFSYFLYKSNPTYTFVEHLIIAIASANFLVLAMESTYRMVSSSFRSGNYQYVIPIVLGLLVLTQFSKKNRWMARYPGALLTGVGLGLGVRATVHMDFVKNIQSLALPLIGGKTTPLDNILSIVLTAVSVYYFVFTRKETSPFSKGVATLGRYAILIFFGATFANTVMSRFSWLAGSIQTILRGFGLL